MATASNKLEIDDTQPLSCTFLNTETVEDHVVYIIKVQRGYDSKYSWQIKKRYTEFNELYAQLKPANYELPLPPKKAFGNMKREFLSTRQIGLQDFIEKILNNLLLANSLAVKKFLDQENYSINFKEIAVAHVSMFFRSEPNWQVIEALNDIGWRFRKNCILLKNTDFPNNKYILTSCEHGPDKILKEPELKLIFQQFSQIQHEYIDPIIRINTGDNSTLIIQKFNEKYVSLRDYIYRNSKITSNYLKKYSQQKSYQTLPVNLVKQISKKILLALQFIYSKRLFYGHLHSGNVLIEQNGNSVKLTDLANGILGLPYFYRSYVVEYRKIQNIELVDVYGLGHIIYEMVYGEPLFTASSKPDFNDCPDREVKQILDLLLVDDVLNKNGLPTINELLEMPFFKNTNLDILSTSSSTAAASTSNASNSNVKLFSTSKVKEQLNKAREYIEKKLNEEQKFVYKLKRVSQAEAKLLSEEEIRKRRKEKKKAEKDSNNSLEFPTPKTSPMSINSKSNNKNVNGSLSSSIKSDSNSNFSGLESPPPTPVFPPPPSPLSPVSNKLNTSIAPPPPPPLVLGPPPPPPPALNIPSNSQDRSQLLSSITSFSKVALKKTKTVDKSAPKF